MAYWLMVILSLADNSTTAETTAAGANSSGTDSDPFDSAKSTPQMESVCVCVEEYNPSTSGHLQLAKGDLVESKTVFLFSGCPNKNKALQSQSNIKSTVDF